jgi:hypothetical protein
MKFSKATKEAVTELLTYLAEQENFKSFSTAHGFDKEEIKEVLLEIAVQLKKEASEEMPNQRVNYNEFELSPKALSLISCLSPREEMLLFKTFRLM